MRFGVVLRGTASLLWCYGLRSGAPPGFWWNVKEIGDKQATEWMSQTRSWDVWPVVVAPVPRLLEVKLAKTNLPSGRAGLRVFVSFSAPGSSHGDAGEFKVIWTLSHTVAEGMSLTASRRVLPSKHRVENRSFSVDLWFLKNTRVNVWSIENNPWRLQCSSLGRLCYFHIL